MSTIPRSVIAVIASQIMGRIDATTVTGRAQINTILVLLQDLDIAMAELERVPGDINGQQGTQPGGGEEAPSAEEAT